MDASRRQAGVRVALLVGIVYCIIGRGFALPATHLRVWRLAAWGTSGGVYALHLAYEYRRLRNAPRVTARHAALAVAIGALALAVAGMLHALATTAVLRPAWLLALVLWPAVTAIPAFGAALVAGALLTRVARRADADERRGGGPHDAV